MPGQPACPGHWHESGRQVAFVQAFGVPPGIINHIRVAFAFSWFLPRGNVMSIHMQLDLSKFTATIAGAFTASQVSGHPFAALSAVNVLVQKMFSLTGPLDLGDTGSGVQMLQHKLNEFGKSTGASGLFPIGVDGAFGSKTDAAVRHFQRHKGLVVDGIVGAKTSRALGFANYVAKHPAPVASTNNFAPIGKFLGEIASQMAVSNGGTAPASVTSSLGVELVSLYATVSNLVLTAAGMIATMFGKDVTVLVAQAKGQVASAAGSVAQIFQGGAETSHKGWREKLKAVNHKVMHIIRHFLTRLGQGMAFQKIFDTVRDVTEKCLHSVLVLVGKIRTGKAGKPQGLAGRVYAEMQTVLSGLLEVVSAQLKPTQAVR
jgi:hypothetical protein